MSARGATATFQSGVRVSGAWRRRLAPPSVCKRPPPPPPWPLCPVERAAAVRMMRDTRGKAVAKSDLPSKLCAHCARPFSWRKKWEKDWPSVKYCSKRCRAEAKSAGSSHSAADSSAEEK